MWCCPFVKMLWFARKWISGVAPLVLYGKVLPRFPDMRKSICDVAPLGLYGKMLPRFTDKGKSIFDSAPPGLHGKVLLPSADMWMSVCEVSLLFWYGKINMRHFFLFDELIKPVFDVSPSAVVANSLCRILLNDIFRKTWYCTQVKLRFDVAPLCLTWESQCRS